jgi:hypothetical protein
MVSSAFTRAPLSISVVLRKPYANRNATVALDWQLKGWCVGHTAAFKLTQRCAALRELE